MLPKLSTFILLPIYTTYLSKNDYGIYDLIITLMSFILPLITLQIQQGSFRFLISESNEKEKCKIITNTLIFLICVLLGLLLISVVLFPLNKLYFTIILFYSTQFVVEILSQITRGLGGNKVYSFTNVLMSIISSVLIVVSILFYNGGIFSIIISIMISNILGILLMINKMEILNYYSLTYKDRTMIKQLLRYSAPMVPNQVSWWIVNVSDRLIITYFLGPTYNAVYSVANKIPSIYNVFFNTFNLAWAENASITKDDETLNTKKYYNFIFNKLFVFLATIVILLIAFNKIIFLFLVNIKYIDALPLMPLLYICLFISSIGLFLGGIYVGEKDTKNVGKSSVLSALINILINIIFVKSIGLYAAIFSTMISYIFLSGFRMVDLYKRFGINLVSKKLIIISPFMLVSMILSLLDIRILHFINMLLSIVIFIIFNKQYFKYILKKY